LESIEAEADKNASRRPVGATPSLDSKARAKGETAMSIFSRIKDAIGACQVKWTGDLAPCRQISRVKPKNSEVSVNAVFGRYNSMIKSVAAAIAFALPGFTPTKAQQTEVVKFEPGNYGTLLSGSITGNEYFDYRLGANAGQELFVELTVANTNGDGVVYLNILPPGSTGEAIYNGSMDEDNSETVKLPANGEYTIRVYLMGNDRDAGKTVDFNIDVSIQ
jgi:hypothetical protein